MTVGARTRVRRSPSVAFVDTGTRIAVIDLDRYRDPEVCAFEASGREIWLAIPDQGETLAVIAVAVADRFGAPVALVEPDVIAFASDLLDRGLLTPG